ncbi:MAG: hypothetical protein ACI3XL_03160 [Eubacteriales bacterium]
MKNEKIISALIGLVGACNQNPKTENTDDLLIRALAHPLIGSEATEESILGLVDEIHSEKNAVAPGCACCTAPCGNTSDYDMKLIYTADEEIGNLKIRILEELREFALYEYNSRQTEGKSKIDVTVFYKALSYISYDMEKESFSELLGEMEKIKREIYIQEDYC